MKASEHHFHVVLAMFILHTLFLSFKLIRSNILMVPNQAQFEQSFHFTLVTRYSN